MRGLTPDPRGPLVAVGELRLLLGPLDNLFHFALVLG